ncbi:discoidin domain-containing protein [Micromonospora sp. WMMA1923]|uniref:discoidin domain-containing protein n=1 Tax=Micromonospora sp. WMMA1923 TaxID=3404125 RepID=UPI003B949689
MTREHRRPARDDEAQASEPVPSGAPASPAWHADTGRYRRLGSALNWVGDRIAVVGADPAGVVAAVAAGLPAEPGVVTVLSRLVDHDDWSVVETVLPIAVPPGSRARVAVAGAAEKDLIARLARELTATIDAPRADLVLVPGGSLFAPDGWLRHTPDGVTSEAGRRSPQPDWESDLDGLCVEGAGADELVLLPVPAGLWAFPHRAGAPTPQHDDPAYSIPMDLTRPVLVIGRPGHPEPTVQAIGALLRRLPPGLRPHLVLAPYGSATATLVAGTALAREAGHPVQIRTGLPALTPDGLQSSLVIDHSGAVWASLGTALTLAPTGPARPTGAVRGLDGYPMVAEHVFRLTEHWVAEVTQSGLWVRPPGDETGAQVVRAHRWMFGRLRIFVGAPGQPPGHEVLPVLGALLARMPTPTRRRVELLPAQFAVAAGAGDDLSSDPTTAEAPAVQGATVLHQTPAGTGSAPQRPATLPAAGSTPPAARTGMPAGPARPPVPVAGPTGPAANPTPASGGTGTPAGPPARRQPPTPVATGRPAPAAVEPHRAAGSPVEDDPLVRPAAPGPTSPSRPVTGADPRPDAQSVTGTDPQAETALVRTTAASSTPDKPTTGAQVVPTGTPIGSITMGSDETPGRPIIGHRRRSRRRVTPVLAATAVLAVATASGYALNLTSPGPGGDAPSVGVGASQDAPVDPMLPPALPGVPGPDGVVPSSGAPVPAAATLSAGATPGAGASPEPSTSAAGSAPAPAPAPDGGERPPAAGGGVLPPGAPTAPTAPTGKASPKPAPAQPSTMPGRVNSAGRNLALSGSASASSVEVNAVWDARYAIDGNTDSRWSSSFGSDPQWLAVDLGELWQVTEVRLLWERAYATAYRVEVSTDGRNWQVVYQTGSGSGGTVRIDVPRTPARYVRMVGTARVMQGYGYSLHEFEVR